jgi:hypothetical protein
MVLQHLDQDFWGLMRTKFAVCVIVPLHHLERNMSKRFIDPATEALFKQERAMTKNEFIHYAAEVLFGEGVECLYEQIAETTNEVNMFGDAGPGACLRVQESIREYNALGSRYEKFTGHKFQPIPLPSFSGRYSGPFDEESYGSY